MACREVENNKAVGSCFGLVAAGLAGIALVTAKALQMPLPIPEINSIETGLVAVAVIGFAS